MVLGERFLAEDVQRGTGEFAGVERVDQRVLVDESAAGGVDEERRRPHLDELLGRADAVTLHEATNAPVPDTTSARNQFAGTVQDIEGGERIARVAVDIGADDPVLALVTEDSRERLALGVGREVTVSFKATATRGVFN